MTDTTAAEDPAGITSAGDGIETGDRAYPSASFSASSYSSAALSSPALSVSALGAEPSSAGSAESDPSSGPSAEATPEPSPEPASRGLDIGLDVFGLGSAESTSSRSDGTGPAADQGAAEDTSADLTSPEAAASHPTGDYSAFLDSAQLTSLSLTPPEPVPAEPAAADRPAAEPDSGDSPQAEPAGSGPEQAESGSPGNGSAEPLAEPSSSPASPVPAVPSRPSAESAAPATIDDPSVAVAPTVATRSSGSASLVHSRRAASPEPIGAAVVKGRITVADEVVEKVAVLAAREVPGVAALGSDPEPAFGPAGDRAFGGARADQGARATQGVRAEVQDRQVAIDVAVIVEYGRVIMDVANEVKINVARAVSRMVGLRVVEVNVTVEDVRVPGPSRPDSPAPAEGGDHLG